MVNAASQSKHYINIYILYNLLPNFHSMKTEIHIQITNKQRNTFQNTTEAQVIFLAEMTYWCYQGDIM